MRLDKYLKVSRLVKRRTLAKEISDQGRVTINGNVAKAGTDVKVEDELVIRFGQKSVTVKVTGLSEHASKENAKNMYELIKEERIQPSTQSEEV
ncbi:RNA-binding S4 domain-containing protein [Staphylococcus hominis]|uniref:RNA-binding S4 domain-containing protein n=1 Tax=Staphylococcus hominis TaxID=1290 RepID=UPI000E69C89C|nr:RNA-binding S4 domain-containing protein [Staphylococcus hominis]RIO55962.1 RNA-binding S4 domain-containing protein [Staphylococcus hominis]